MWLKSSVKFFSVSYTLKLTRQIDHVNGLIWSGDGATVPRCWVGAPDIMGGADDLSAALSNDGNFHGCLLCKGLDRQVVEHDHFEEERHVNTAPVGDLKRVENLW